MGRTPSDLTGQRFGRLVVKFKDAKDKRSMWFCECDCGGSLYVRAGDLRSGRTKGCGCLRRERALAGDCARKHGEGAKGKTSAEYEVWKGMNARCYYRKHTGFARYGGRGIQVCSRWRESFQAFLLDMGRRPSPKHSIDRINNDLHYAQHNCRWATREEQARDRDFYALSRMGHKAKRQKKIAAR